MPQLYKNILLNTTHHIMFKHVMLFTRNSELDFTSLKVKTLEEWNSNELCKKDNSTCSAMGG